MLTWLLAWTRLIAEEPDAVDVANAAVARVAARRKRLTGHALRAAARDEAARMLARGVAAAPELDTAGSRMLVAGDRTVPSAAFTPPTDAGSTPAAAPASAFAPPADVGVSDVETTLDDRPTYPLTPAERLALALKDLAPYERLACVVAVLDGASTAEVAALLGVTHARAAAILDRAYPRLAAVTGEAERPDFHTIAGDEVAVVVR